MLTYDFAAAPAPTLTAKGGSDLFVLKLAAASGAVDWASRGGLYDEEYVNARLRIGKVHRRIGVSPKLYVSAVWFLERVVLDYLEAAGDGEHSE